MSYSDAVCKGGLLWTRIQNAFDGHMATGPPFGLEVFVNSWSLKVARELQGGLKDRWWDAFLIFAPFRISCGDQVRSLSAVQDKTFRLSDGRLVTVSNSHPLPSG